MQPKQSEKLLQKAQDHTQALQELETEAAAAGRRLTDEEQAYVAELRTEGSQIIGTALRASQQEKDRTLGSVVTTDASGVVLTKSEIEEAKHPAKTATTAGHIAD